MIRIKDARGNIGETKGTLYLLRKGRYEEGDGEECFRLRKKLLPMLLEHSIAQTIIAKYGRVYTDAEGYLVFGGHTPGNSPICTCELYNHPEIRPIFDSIGLGVCV